ncbi:acyl-CoA synthetase [Polaribacter sp.]|uniref:acyl-CoA synthetase n=1 Tax=Polaribacter sp. TaxID=1920175 RepID=UPI003F6B8645
MLGIVKNAHKHLERVCVKSNNRQYSYQTLLNKSESIAVDLLAGKKDLNEQRVTFLVDPGFVYVSIQWGIWRAGGIAVPLCVKHPLESIKYVLDDTNTSVLIYSEKYKDLLEPVLNNNNIRCIKAESFTNIFGSLPVISLDRRAMIIYTSGTTGAPKGVVSTHQNIESQVVTLIKSWEWEKKDHILNVLPMHHVHGIVNITLCALWSGACCEFLPKFNAKDVFDLFKNKEINIFMAVPTIYYKLISFWKTLPKNEQQEISNTLEHFRLMVSGSAALPVSVLKYWKSISKHTLLERYGMTEIGMAISNPYRGKRKPGHIGQPLQGVSIRIAEDNGKISKIGEPGEIQVKGNNVFKEYWNKPKETKESFTKDNWFKTGDIAIFQEGSFKILGRNSVDIIKNGGYKVSALEIEEVLRKYKYIADCGVVGLPDEEWGEIIAVCIVINTKSISIDELKEWLKLKLPSYKIPTKYNIQKELPVNVMGKVVKNEIKKLF